jgi:PPK2 family polyphosphate:nucleotide phosphotransferase
MPRGATRRRGRDTMADPRAELLLKFIEPFRVEPGSKVNLPKDHDPGFKAGWVRRQDGDALLRSGVELLAEYQERLSAHGSFGVLVILQGLDAGGKDSTIRHVMSGVNPQGVVVHSFKAPSAEELAHDFLWRCARRLPARGQIGIFNRSHYEEVLVVKVHPELLAHQRLPPTARKGNVWKHRYREINDWEHHLVENGFRVVKLMLNISREEQRRRFLERIERPEKNWKFSPSDLHERAYWDEYQRAFSDMLTNTSTAWAPWHVIPADHKWFAHIAAGAVLVKTLTEIDPRFPTPEPETMRTLEQARAQLIAEAPAAAPSAAAKRAQRS